MNASQTFKMAATESKEETYLFERIRGHQIFKDIRLWEDSVRSEILSMLINKLTRQTSLRCANNNQFFDELLKKHREIKASRPPLPKKPASQSARPTGDKLSVKGNTLKRHISNRTGLVFFCVFCFCVFDKKLILCRCQRTN